MRRWGIATNAKNNELTDNMKIDSFNYLTSDTMPCHDLSDADLCAGGHPLYELATANGHASLKSFINDMNLWSATVGDAAKMLIADFQSTQPKRFRLYDGGSDSWIVEAETGEDALDEIELSGYRAASKEAGDTTPLKLTATEIDADGDEIEGGEFASKSISF